MSEEYGYIINCEVMRRDPGNYPLSLSPLFERHHSGCLIPKLDGYAILPKEQLRSINAELTRLRAEVETMRNAAIHWHDERDTIERSTIERCEGIHSALESSLPEQDLSERQRGYEQGIEDYYQAIRALKEGER